MLVWPCDPFVLPKEKELLLFHFFWWKSDSWSRAGSHISLCYLFPSWDEWRDLLSGSLLLPDALPIRVIFMNWFCEVSSCHGLCLIWERPFLGLCVGWRICSYILRRVSFMGNQPLGKHFLQTWLDWLQEWMNGEHLHLSPKMESCHTGVSSSEIHGLVEQDPRRF